MPANHQRVRPTTADVLARLDELHSAPGVALRVLEITSDPDFDVADVVNCLEHDPPLAALILRSVNSSYYGVSQRINNLPQAVAYLGRRALRQNVLSFGLVTTFVRGAPAELHQQYWKRSLTMAAGARRAAEMAGFGAIDIETAYTAGLLADLGMLVMAQLEPQSYIEVATDTSHMVDLVDLERQVFGFDHRTVGQLLFEKWQMPDELISAVVYHHSYDSKSPLLNQLLLIANLLTEALWTPGGNHIEPLQWLMSTHLQMDVDDLITLAVDTREAVNRGMELFDVRLEDDIDLAAMEQHALNLREQQPQTDALTLNNFVVSFDPYCTSLPALPD